MKIVQLITHMHEIGGAQVHVRDISRRLFEEGHTVSIIYGGGKEATEDLKIDGVNYFFSKYLIRQIHVWKDLIAFIEVRRMLKDIQPDLVAIHSSKAGIVGRIASWSVRIPCVFTAHGWAFTEGVEPKKQRLYRTIEKGVGKLSKKVITVCDQDRNLALSHNVLPANKIKTIHNGVLDSRYSSINSITNDEVKILMVARFDQPKQQLQLLHALMHIKDLNWHMIFVGDGRLKQSSVQYVQENDLADKVTFLGTNSNVSELLNEADIFVLTSAWEGLPLSILEAMSHGLPIIASNVGGVKEAVRDNENGFLINGNLTESIKLLVENELLRVKMGTRSREIYEASFTFDNMYEKTVNLYRNLIKSEDML